MNGAMEKTKKKKKKGRENCLDPDVCTMGQAGPDLRVNAVISHTGHDSWRLNFNIL